MSFITEDEKDELIGMMGLLYGDDFAQTIDRSAITDSTYDQVEDALIALTRCNENMKELVTDLVGGGRRLAARGWLKKSLKQVHKALKKDKSSWNGLACRNVLRLYRRTAIETTLY
ncbi:hypothetical protein [Pseudomonas mangiferae]|uniref:Uncharacterized protein n=1 Tax=Pseudomonas mangiferae TaxID=2593654 RepID=A0A553H4C4_9PSED|nr:hypothetical protein [Pseudomonas mangiferae]TRX76602.1 hypothetical protein FM069_00845 [Pseudomonas mangiferae]